MAQQEVTFPYIQIAVEIDGIVLVTFYSDGIPTCDSSALSVLAHAAFNTF